MLSINISFSSPIFTFSSSIFVNTFCLHEILPNTKLGCSMRTFTMPKCYHYEMTNLVPSPWEFECVTTSDKGKFPLLFHLVLNLWQLSSSTYADLHRIINNLLITSQLLWMNTHTISWTELPNLLKFHLGWNKPKDTRHLSVPTGAFYKITWINIEWADE